MKIMMELNPENIDLWIPDVEVKESNFTRVHLGFFTDDAIDLMNLCYVRVGDYLWVTNDKVFVTIKDWLIQSKPMFLKDVPIWKIGEEGGSNKYHETASIDMKRVNIGSYGFYENNIQNKYNNI